MLSNNHAIRDIPKIISQITYVLICISTLNRARCFKITHTYFFGFYILFFTFHFYVALFERALHVLHTIACYVLSITQSAYRMVI